MLCFKFALTDYVFTFFYDWPLKIMYWLFCISDIRGRGGERMDDLASSESLATFYWLPKCSDNFLRGGGYDTEDFHLRNDR